LLLLLLLLLRRRRRRRRRRRMLATSSSAVTAARHGGGSVAASAAAPSAVADHLALIGRLVVFVWRSVIFLRFFSSFDRYIIYPPLSEIFIPGVNRRGR
jgi:hypothetical protein